MKKYLIYHHLVSIVTLRQSNSLAEMFNVAVN